MKKTMMMLLFMMVSMAVAAKSYKTVVFTTQPQMHCPKCENKVKGNMRFEKGVKEIETSVADQTVTIKYDAKKTDVETLVKAFEKHGYKVRELQPGETVVKEPHECKEMR